MLRLIRSWLFREIQCAGFKIEYVNSIYYLPYLKQYQFLV